MRGSPGRVPSGSCPQRRAPLSPGILPHSVRALPQWSANSEPAVARLVVERPGIRFDTHDHAPVAMGIGAIRGCFQDAGAATLVGKIHAIHILPYIEGTNLYTMRINQCSSSHCFDYHRIHIMKKDFFQLTYGFV